MTEENRQPIIPLKAYFSGAVISAVPTYFLTLLSTTFLPSIEEYLTPALFIISFAGGAVGYHLFLKRYPDANKYTSTLIGLLAYVIYVVFNSLSGVVLSMNDTFIVVGFIFGGEIGNRIVKNRRIG